MDTISKQYEQHERYEYGQHEQYQRYRARKRPLSGTQDGSSYGGGAPWES
ncbi:hypothetical protein [Streptomyces sp. ALI-76-A]|nr:hypothetical protein [Streptomyces sp. ALI-76-A]MDL5202664.1 hypothetical protein [Streptomyces sp. ALI-76-A]